MDFGLRVDAQYRTQDIKATIKVSSLQANTIQ